MVRKNLNSNPVGISLPISILERIDKERGDVGRSRYVLRIIEKYYGLKK